MNDRRPVLSRRVMCGLPRVAWGKGLTGGCVTALLLSACAPTMPGDTPRSAPIAPPLPPSSVRQPMPMLDDPEAKTTQWEEDAGTKNEAIANQICEKKAEDYSRTGARVTFIGLKTSSSKQRYCIFETEEPQDTDDRDSWN